RALRVSMSRAGCCVGCSCGVVGSMFVRSLRRPECGDRSAVTELEVLEHLPRVFLVQPATVHPDQPTLALQVKLVDGWARSATASVRVVVTRCLVAGGAVRNVAPTASAILRTVEEQPVAAGAVAEA